MGNAVLFFDLFFTLITPEYSNNFKENDVLSISVEEWESIAEDRELYVRRATGKVLNPHEIIDKIMVKGDFITSVEEKNQVLELRINRMRSALQNIDRTILDTLSCLRARGLRLCIISNADTIDKMGWIDSPLSQLFDEAIFSCDIGAIKPQPDIYKAAMNKMDASPQNCYFIGDGGSGELYGAQLVGMKTVLSDHLVQRTDSERAKLLEHSDYHIKVFSELLEIPF